MKGKSLIAENLELAYKTWRECGQSPEQTVRKLESEHDFTVSRQTLYDWMEKFHWKERAARAEAVEQWAKDPQLTGPQKMLAALVAQKNRYETYFETLSITSMDHQAMYAYTNLVKTLDELQRRADEKPDLFRMTPIVMEAFVAFIKKTTKDAAMQEQVFGLIDRFFDEVKPDGV